MKRNTKNTINPFSIIVCILLSVYALTIAFTLIWGINTSFKHNMDFSNPNRNVLGLPNLEVWKLVAQKYPGQNLFSNYVNVIQNLKLDEKATFYTMWSDEPVKHIAKPGIFELLWNTISYALLSAFVQAMVPCFMGYLCSKYSYKFSEFLYAFSLIQMMIPVIGAYPAELALLKGLGIYDSLIGNLIQKASFMGIYFFIFYAYFKGVPDSYIEAAEVDGASQFRIMTTIMLPLAIKTISTVTLLRFVGFWNDYNVAVLYLPTRPTLAFAIHRACIQEKVPEVSSVPAKVAACIVLALPILIIFVVLKDKLMGNVSMGGVKG